MVSSQAPCDIPCDCQGIEKMGVITGNAFLLNQLKERSPLTIGQFMELVLYDPVQGYYAPKNPVGKRGDFITAPEISQIFGELVGLWCVDTWLKLGGASPVHLIELGPGTGAMMADLLRATQHIPGFHASVQVHLVETSPVLQSLQKSRLKSYDFITWHSSLSQVPGGFSIVVANEFFDALPLNQVICFNKRWYERMVVVYEDGGAFKVTLERGEDVSNLISKNFLKNQPPPSLPTEGSVHEYSPLRDELWQAINNRLKTYGGGALVIDYGAVVTPWIGETLQAVHRHKKVPVFSHVGEADLTHHVDFSALHHQTIQEGLYAQEVISQGEFLKNMGIEQRLTMLSAKASSVERSSLYLAAARLCAPQEMGELFKVLAVTSAPISMAGF